ncbi:sugar phosphate isomerase/epimerase [Streptacidiphilus sp. P02-A3a]|uniref:sugar phosphate isomerase/epimerase family protein n=1 Tax=Streptacidiphilus sp. P02-A3a TaxID=2704468 RepID=UPI0015FA6C72|nr:hypothetical protein [Streptacidiphilus sp. P02-A3a]QMU71687.1 hypothetical protein GXP74_29025 [Streptacidiphilus sp. P02-A3a]
MSRPAVLSPLTVHCSLLSTIGLPRDTTPAACLRRIADAGFDGVQTNPPADAPARRRLGELLDDLGLDASACGGLDEDEDPEPLFERAADAGMISLNAQVNGYWRDDDWQDARVTRLLELSDQYELPFFLETHRHRMTQDIRRTLALVERHPGLVLCGDFSHYTVMSELRAPWPDEWRTALHALAGRCGEVHARVNDGQRVQDPLPLVGDSQRDEFFDLWGTARRTWRGSPFLVTTELLPKQIGYDSTDLLGRPIGDIWQDSRRLLTEVRSRLTA